MDRVIASPRIVRVFGSLALRTVTFSAGSIRGVERRAPGEVDYRLARQHLISEYRKGRLAQHEVCDAHPELVRAGFATVTSPGRLEVVRRSPTVVVDAAHNPHGARALAAALDEGFDFASLVGVVAVLADKDARGLLEALEPVLTEIVVTRSSSPRATDPDVLAALAVELFGPERVTVEARLAGAIEVAIERADELMVDAAGGVGVLITGSVVTAAEARALLGRGEA